jgi:hypothetical protein
MDKFNSISGNKDLKRIGLQGLGLFAVSLGFVIAMGHTPAYASCASATIGGGGGSPCGGGGSAPISAAPVAAPAAPAPAPRAPGGGSPVASGAPVSFVAPVAAPAPAPMRAPAPVASSGRAPIAAIGTRAPVASAPAISFPPVDPASFSAPASGCQSRLTVTQQVMNMVLPAVTTSVAQNNPGATVSVAFPNSFNNTNSSAP